MRAVELLMTAAAVLASGTAQADVTISTKPTQNMSCQAGVCSPTAQKAALNVNDLAGMLASGDVTVNSGGSLAKNIVVKDALSWTATSRLTLDANQSVEIDKPVTVAGTGAITITYNDGGSGGDLLFEGKGNATFWDLPSSLVINSNSYILVKKLRDLKKAIAANPTGFFALAANYNAQKDGTYSKTVIHTVGVNQTIEGLGNQIQNLTMASTAHPVLALIKDNRGTIRDLGLTNVNINAPNSGAAGLVIFNEQQISNVYVSGTIAAADQAAGIAAQSIGTIANSHVAVNVSGTDDALTGPISGDNGGLIQASYAMGAVTGSYAGGIAGINGGTISQCYSAAAVTPIGRQGGGLVGQNDGVITNSYATGQVNGGGGAIGTNGGSSIAAIYSTGFVNSGGGLVGVDEAQTFSNSYWDLDTSGISNPHQGAGTPPDDPGITGLTDDQLKSGLPEGFDAKIWGQKQSINGGYPYLRAIPPS